MTLPKTAAFGEFAKIAGFKPGYITQLKKDDRLVLTDDGKRVRVAESLERIAATRDPAKIGVVQRHANERAQGDAAAVADTDAQPESADADSGAGYQYWRERSERAKALAAERENEVAEGRLLGADDVAAAVAHAASTLRSRFEALPDVLAPQVVAAGDEAKARALLADAIEHALAETSRQFFALAKKEAA